MMPHQRPVTALMNLSEMTLTWISVFFFTSCVLTYRALHVKAEPAIARRQRIFFGLVALTSAALALFFGSRGFISG
jgi:hypothetical protein